MLGFGPWSSRTSGFVIFEGQSELGCPLNLKGKCMNLTNILGTIAAVVALLGAALTDIAGCAVDAAGVTTCTASWLTPKLAGWATIAMSGVLLVSKIIRPGGPLRGLFGSTAVVVPPDEAKPGVVTPGQVAAQK